MDTLKWKEFYPKIGFVLLIILTLIFKVAFFDYQYGDYTDFLSVWLKEIHEGGGLAALKDPFYNYTPPYLYILVLIDALGNIFPVNNLYAIKIVSILFEYILAFFVGRLAYLYTKQPLTLWLPFILIPLAPSVIVNSSFMSQCDAIYVTFIVGSLYFLLTKRQLWAMLFLGIAFALKLQSAFILPFYFVYMLRGHIKWYYFLSIPLVYLISIIPVWIAGRPLFDLLTIYANQAGANEMLALSFANIYMWIDIIANPLYVFLSDSKLYGMAFVAILIFLLGLELSKKKYTFTLDAWLKLAFVSALVCPFLLPGMLDRYLYLADMLSILYVLCYWKRFLVAAGIIFTSFFCCVRAIYLYSPDFSPKYYLFDLVHYVPWKAVLVIYTLVVCYVVYDFVKTLRQNKNQSEFISTDI